MSCRIGSRIYGDKEIELFQTLCPQPEWVAQKLSHILLMQVLPALVEGDMHTFGKALDRIQTFGWKKVEIEAQGAELRLTLDFLRDSGVFGAGVSSWGSAICVMGEDIDRLKRDAEAFLKTLPEGGFPVLLRRRTIWVRTLCQVKNKNGRMVTSARHFVLSLAWGIVRVIPGTMIGGVNHALNLRKDLLNHCLDAVFECDVCHTAALAAAAHMNVYGIILDIQEFYLPTVCRNSRINPFINGASEPLVLLDCPMLVCLGFSMLNPLEFRSST